MTGLTLFGEEWLDVLGVVDGGGKEEDGREHRLVKHGRKIHSFRFIVQADGHEGHREKHTQAIVEGPAEEFGVASGDQDAGAADVLRTGDERDDFGVGFADRVAEVAEGRGVTGDAAVAFDDERRPVLDAFGEFRGAREAVDLFAEFIASGLIIGRCGANGAAIGHGFRDIAVDDRKRLAGIEAEFGVERQRSIVERGLHQPNTGGVVGAGFVDHRLHESTAKALVLDGGINRDGADAGDGAAEVDDVRAEDGAVGFGDEALKTGGIEEVSQDADTDFDHGEFGREVVISVDLGKGFVADPAAGGRVCGSRATDSKCRHGLYRGNDHSIGSRGLEWLLLLMTNQTIGHYQVLEKLGEGGMGAVYKARDTRLNRYVALKVLAAARSEQAEMRQRFRQEAQAASALGHANIVVVHDFVEHEGAECIVMEFVDGQTLEQKLQRGPMRLRDAIRCAAQVADALAAAHKAGVIHRDLKPGNIMLTEDGVVKVVDFGLAKLTESRAVGDETETQLLQSAEGTIAGTAAYMSPEQAEGQKVDTRSDIFSFGAVLYEMVTGKRAFTGASRVSLITAVIRDEPAPISKTLPAGLQMVVQGCLQKDAGRRFQHAGDVRMVLEKVGEELDSGVSAAAPVAAAAPKRNWLAWGMLAAGLAAGGAGAFLMRPGKVETPPMRFTRMTYDARSYEPTISPDGKLVAYASSRPDGTNTDIWLQQISGGGVIRLTEHPAMDYSPDFSPDGSLLYFRSRRTPDGIYSVSVLGGEARLVAQGGRRPRVSPDGKWLAYVRGTRYMIRALPDGDERDISGGTQAPFEAFLNDRFCWSPDSRRILAPRLTGGRSEFWILAIDGNGAVDTGLMANLNARRMTAGGQNAVTDWLDSGEIHFTAPAGQTTGLWRLQLEHLRDGVPEAITAGVGRVIASRARSDRIVVSSIDGLPSAWMIPGDPNRGEFKGEPYLLAEGGGMMEFPDALPDGSKVVFTRASSGYETLLLDRATGRLRTLPAPPKSVYGVISPDGAQVAVATGDGDSRVLYTVPVGGGAPVKRSDERVMGRLWGWSADGNFILLWRAFQGKSAAAVMDLRNGKIAEILQGVAYPRFSPDGKWIAFRVQDRLMIAPFEGSTAIPESKWHKAADGVSHVIWAPDGASIYFTQSREETGYLVRRALDRDTKKPLGAPADAYRFDPRSGFRPEDIVTNRVVAVRDGLIVRLQSFQSDVWLVDLK